MSSITITIALLILQNDSTAHEVIAITTASIV